MNQIFESNKKRYDTKLDVIAKKQDETLKKGEAAVNLAKYEKLRDDVLRARHEKQIKDKEALERGHEDNLKVQKLVKQQTLML